MDTESLLRNIQAVVTQADEDGEIDAGLFTIKLARERVARTMELEPDALKTGDMKSTFKTMIEEAIISLSSKQGEQQDEAAGSSSTSRGRIERHKAATTGSFNEADTFKQIPEEHARSESEMSSLIDEQPARTKKNGKANGSGRKRKSEGEDSKPKKLPRTSETKPTAKTQDVEDERVKELKAIVTACGVRKQWKKEFADCPSPASQVRHLESLLRSLGMKGQPTKGKAKSLKQKRELAAELQDVTEFESERGLGLAGSAGGSGRGEERTTRNGSGKREDRGRRGTVVVSDSEEDVQSED